MTIKKHRPIIITDDKNKSETIGRSEFDNEEQLQKVIKEHPDIIPVYEISEDKKLFVASREFPVHTGRADAIAVDRDGDIYIIEAKLESNTTRREVVAQALDYGAALWKHFNDFSEMIKIFDKEVKESHGLSFEEAIKDEFKFDQDYYDKFFSELEMNLNKGIFKFVVVMDEIEARLKDIITYVNRNSNFDIYAVRMELYKFEKRQILIPKIFGVEPRKNLGVASSRRKIWDEKGFIAQTKEILKDDANKIVDIYEYFYKKANKITFGSGTTASFSPMFFNINKTTGLFSFFSDGSVLVKFKWFSHIPDDKKEIVDKCVKIFIENYNFLPNLKASDKAPVDYMNEPFTIKRGVFFDNYNAIKKTMEKIVEYIASVEEK